MSGTQRGISERVSAALRARIVGGDLAMGQRLNDKQLAEETGVSRTPIREALLQLQNEGLIVIKPQSGTYVFSLTIDELGQLCETRAIMEEGAIRKCVASSRPNVLNNLGLLVSEAAIALEDGDLARCNELDWLFHEALVAATGNKFLIASYAAISSKLRALRHHMPLDRARIGQAIIDHRRILDLAIAGRVDDAIVQIDSHVANVERILASVDQRVIAQ